MEAEERSQLMQTALNLIDSYNAWDMDRIMAPRHPSCTQKVYPERLNRPAFNNDEYREYFGVFMDHFQNYKIEILEAVEDTKGHKISLHLKATADSAVGPYLNEFAVFLYTTEDDKQITQVKEFVDSGFSIEFFTRMRAHMASLK